MDVRKCIERYIETYNQPGSPVFDLYADRVEWVFISGGALAGGPITDYETPVGHCYGREELFAAFREARGITADMQARGEYVVPPKPGAIVDMHFPAIRAINAAGDLGVLECTWAGTYLGADGAPDTPMTADMVFVFRFNDQGLITLHHDYLLWHQRKFNNA